MRKSKTQEKILSNPAKAQHEVKPINEVTLPDKEDRRNSFKIMGITKEIKYDPDLPIGRSPFRIVEVDGKLVANIKEGVTQESMFNQTLGTTGYEYAMSLTNCMFALAKPQGDHEEQLKAQNILLQSLADNGVKDPTEAKLFMQADTLFKQGMKYLARAEDSDMIPQADFYMKNATKLLRLHNETVEAISRYRRGGEQKVTVQHVQVNDGGKAIVGGVFEGGGGNK